MPSTPPARSKASGAGFQTPERSGLPSAARGVAALRSGLPSAPRGSDRVGWLSHWARADVHVTQRTVAATPTASTLCRKFMATFLHEAITKDKHLSNREG